MLLHLDCGAGISGAATLAALAHLGVDYAPLAGALARVGVLCSIDVADAVGPAGPGRSVSICWQKGVQQPCHLPECTAIIDNIDVPSRVRQRAAAAVHALAEACAYASFRIRPDKPDRSYLLADAACKQDNARGCGYLGYNYENGVGATTNLYSARDYYNLGCAKGYSTACGERDRLNTAMGVTTP